MHADTRIKIGISSCLLGENVRYDGQHKYAGYIVEALGPYVEFLPVCPETAIGLGVPRPPLTAFGIKQAAALNTISGYIFKSRSPSCGLTDTPISTNRKEFYGAGLYARQIIEAFPLLPVTDEVSLRHENHVDHFLQQVLTYNHRQQLTGNHTE